MTHLWDPDNILCLLKPLFSKILLISKRTIVTAAYDKTCSLSPQIVYTCEIRC